MRIGQGWDVHRLVEGRRLVVGGVEIPHAKGELGHSDGDALLHAITDALLGAAALGDIGTHFPPSDQRWKDADSRKILALAAEKVRAAGYRVVNVDCTVIIQEPRLSPLAASIRASIADAMGLGPEAVSFKAKTFEGLGDVGRGEAIEAMAVALLENG